MDPTRVAFGSEGLTVGTYANLLVMHFHGRLTVQDLERAKQVHVELIAQHPGATAVFAFADPDTPVPNADVREASTLFVREVAPHMLATALVIEAGGFRGSAIRSFLTAVYFVAKQSFPMKVFARVDEASEWFAPRVRCIPSQVLGVVQTIQRAAPARIESTAV